MKRNYHCCLDFDILASKISQNSIEFLKNLVQKDPNLRLTAEMALEEETILSNFMDEDIDNNFILRNKLRKTPKL